MIEDAMGNLSVRIMDPKDRDGGPYFNQAATDEVNAKIQGLRERFSDWAWQDAERKIVFEKAYNEVMNAIAKPHYDGSFMDMSGMSLRRGDDPFSLRRHQINAIWRGVIQGRGLFAHEVGTGKTLVLGGIAVEGRRYGVFCKPLIFAHNANSSSVAREIGEMYPGGRFLYVDNLKPDEIKTTLHRIASDDWDAVIMPHSLIDKMTLKRDTLRELAADQIAELEAEAIAAAREDGQPLTTQMMDDKKEMGKLRSPTAKQLVNQRNNIIANIEKQANRSSEEGAVPFEDLGIDSIIVDESHEFKKPPIATRMKLKGLNTQTSNRSIALNFLTGYVKKNNNGRGVYLFTGTPITNSLNEIFNMGRYFMDDKMALSGIRDWDAWFNTFASAVSDVELTAAGTYEPVTRLSSFDNVDELIRMMSEFTDVVQAKDMPEFVARTTPSGKTLASPDLTAEERAFLVDGRSEKPEGRPYKKIVTDVAEMSPDQKRILDHIRKLSQEFKEAGGKDRWDWMRSGDERSPVLLETAAANAGIDPRLYDPDAKDVPDSKINRVVRNVLKHYQEPNSGQVIFVDRGYNAVKSSEGRQDRFVLTRDIINKLVEGGIPRKEIAIVAGGLEPEQKKMLADKMNTGELRVVIGQSGTLGVGVNMQVNLRAMHHMDAPWRPGDLEQRNGRGERQGNKWNTVLEYRYVTEGIDGRRWQVLTLKDKFIKQFINAFNDESGKRIGSIEGDAADISDDEDILNTLSAAAGDPRIAIREKIKSDVERLQKRERMHVTGLEDARSRAAMLKRSISDFLGRASTYELSLQTWDDASKRAEDDAKAAGEKRRWYEATVDGKPARTGDQIQEGIDAQVKALAKGDKRTLATINGFDIEADWTGGRQEPIYRMLHDGDSLAVIQAPTMPRIIAEIRGIRDDANMYRLKVQDAKESIPRLEAAANEPFPQQAALERKRQQLAQIEDDLQANPVPPPGWLRHGAPIGSDIYVNGRALTVEGHRMDTDYTVVTNEGEVPYLDAKDANGQRIFDVHPPPTPGAAKVVPEWAAKVAKERKAEIVWHNAKKGLALALGHENDEPVYFGIRTKNGKTNVTSGDVDTMSREDFATFDRQDFTEFRTQKETAVRRAERDAQRAAAAEKAKNGRAVYEPRQFAGEPSADEAKPRGYGGGLEPMLSRNNARDGTIHPDALQAMVDDAQRIVGPHVRIEVHEGSGLLVKRNGQTELVDGMTLGRLIRVALNGGVGTTLDHEAVHALFNLGAFKPQEWAALTHAAERQNWIGRYGIDKTYSDMPHDVQIEEAIAHRFADPSPRSPLVERAMRAVQAFMERVRNALAGRGFQTSDDVFGRVRRGEVGAREPGSGSKQRGPQTVGESHARMEKWHEGEPQFAKLPASAKKPFPLKPDPAWKRAVDEIRTVLSPTSRGSDAKRQEYAHREFGARLAQASQIAAHRLEDARRLVSRYSPDEQDEQNHKLETGQPLGDPKLDAAAKALRESQAEWLQKLQSLGYLKDTIDNYMGHIYSNYREWKAGQIGTLTPTQVDARNRMLAAMKRPIRGTGEFLKQRTFDTLQDAMAAGLEPVTHNWVDMQLLKLRSMQRFYEGTQYAEKMKKTGLAFWVPVTATRDAEASGFKKLNDEIFQPRIRSDAEYGVREVGNWMAPGPAADVFNNAMAPGLMSKWPTIYGGLRSTANALNGLQLGLSGFHATFEALDSIHSQTALGLRQISRGSIGKGVRTIASAYAAPVTTWRAGNQFIHAYLDPDNASPEMRRIVDAAIKGGVRIGYDKF